MMRKILLTLVFVLLPAICFGQGRVYTKKARLADYASQKTRIVLTGNTVIDGILQREVPALWRINPYEFCTEKEYEQSKGKSGYYFLRVVSKSEREDIPGVVCLYLQKGGSTNKESKNAAIDIVQVPVASDPRFISALEIACFPAFIDIVQQYVVEAAASSFVAAAGLSAYPPRPALDKYEVKRIVADPEKAVGMLENYEVQGAVAVIVGPLEQNKDAVYYHMVIGTDNHRLYSYNSWKGASDFTASERKMLTE